jgi:hypothetical protein
MADGAMHVGTVGERYFAPTTDNVICVEIVAEKIFAVMANFDPRVWTAVADRPVLTVDEEISVETAEASLSVPTIVNGIRAGTA